MMHWKDKADFKEEVYKWAKKLEVNVQALALRPMSNKWASCSTRGNLNFNDELLSIDREIGIYVIVHELLHFHYPNHGPLWKSMMAHYLSDYEAIEKKLKNHGSNTTRFI
jgi:predicted metal-dependent hydrolase